jgi:hypothetical protein
MKPTIQDGFGLPLGLGVRLLRRQHGKHDSNANLNSGDAEKNSPERLLTCFVTQALLCENRRWGTAENGQREKIAL